MDQAGGLESKRVAAVSAQAASDAWRGKGVVTPWGQLAQGRVPHDYGDEDAIAEQHAETMAWANKMEGSRVAKI
jgi:hypothetical protein